VLPNVTVPWPHRGADPIAAALIGPASADRKRSFDHGPKVCTALNSSACFVATSEGGQVAAEFISPKTVQWNLSKVYRKLEIRSRAELPGRLEHR